jgi:hypothetical protein
MKHKGIEKQTIANAVESVYMMNRMANGKFLVPLKRKPRALETKKRDLVEKHLERDIIYNLTNRGYKVAKSGEQATYNSHFCLDGMTDLIVFVEGFGVIFMEVKQEKYRNAKNGGLRDTQVEFMNLCRRCKLKHCVVYSVKEAESEVLMYMSTFLPSGAR